MIHTYRYEFINGHIIAIVGQLRLLIDTGSPSSCADSSPIEIGGGSFQIQRNYMGVTPESLSASVGTTINGLVGADILNRYDILIDPKACTVTLTEEELPLEGVCLELSE